MRTFVIVHNIPSPYRIHLFSAMHRELARRGVAFHAHFMSRGHVERPDSWRGVEIPFPHTYWNDYGPRLKGIEFHFNPGLIFHLQNQSPADFLVLCAPWSIPTGVINSLVAKRRNSIIWIEVNTKTPGRIHGLIANYKRFILRQFDFVAIPGKEGRDYLDRLYGQSCNIKPTPVVLPNVVDETRFRPRGTYPPEVLTALRRKFGFQADEPVAICPARLIPVKGLQEYFSAISPGMLNNWKILIIGDGPLAVNFSAQIALQGYADRVCIHSSVPYEQMPAVYAMADLFMLPSLSDINPLSVVEAMHSGLPLLLSNRVGNFPEALAEGINGWGFDPGHAEDVRRASSQAFSTAPKQMRHMGTMSSGRANMFWSTTQVVQNFLDSVGI